MTAPVQHYSYKDLLELSLCSIRAVSGNSTSTALLLQGPARAISMVHPNGRGLESKYSYQSQLAARQPRASFRSLSNTKEKGRIRKKTISTDLVGKQNLCM